MKKLHDVFWGSDCFLYDPQSTGNKSKNRQMRLHQNLVHRKGSNQQSEEIIHSLGEIN
jgi:hypothetical protein